jgi:hypothetical protein
MWMSAIIVLCGAELNSEIERQTVIDNTQGNSKLHSQEDRKEVDRHPRTAQFGRECPKSDIKRHTAIRRNVNPFTLVVRRVILRWLN